MLRPYQIAASSEIKAALKGHRAVLYQAPTGSGKTTLTSHIFAGLYRNGLRGWFIVHRHELIEQVSAALSLANVPHGIVCPGYPFNPDAPIQVCMVQTLARRKLPAPWLAVVDECHHAVSPTYMRVLSDIPNARILGLTATPERLDGRGLGDVFQTLIPGPSVAELTTQGHLAPFRLWAPPGISLDGVHTRAGDYAREDLAKAADRPGITGDAIAHYQKLCPGRRFVVFCSNIAHSKHVAAQFNAAGIPTRHVDGETPDAERREAMALFRAGIVHGLANVDLFGEGVDVPGIEAVIMLRPTQSMGLYLQMVGRGLRPAPGKPCAYILDHAGNAGRHGFPDDPHTWTLDARRRKARTTDEPTIRIRVCPVCFAAVRAGVTACPLGHVFTVDPMIPKVTKGELKEIRRVAAVDRKREEGRATTFDDLVALGQSRGYHPGWAINRWRARHHA